jgi:hypothetical protein
MKSLQTLFRYSIFCLLATSNCKQENNNLPGYSYSLTVADTNPMRGVQNSLIVEIRTTDKTQQAYADLAYYTHYQSINKGKEVIPMDTLRTSLSRIQTDSIYYLARHVFTISTQPILRPDSLPFPPSAHDLDNYLDVSFSPYEGAGPTLSCIGYQEHNQPAYTLYTYLTKLSTSLVAKRH